MIEYPKMLYKGDPIYTDSDKMKDDLMSKKIKTFIVADQAQEEEKRAEGYVSLPDLMQKRPTLTLKKA